MLLFEVKAQKERFLVMTQNRNGKKIIEHMQVFIKGNHFTHCIKLMHVFYIVIHSGDVTIMVYMTYLEQKELRDCTYSRFANVS